MISDYDIGAPRPTSVRLASVQGQVRGLIASVEDDLRDRAQSGESDEMLEHVAGELRVMLDGLLDIGAQIGVRR